MEKIVKEYSIPSFEKGYYLAKIDKLNKRAQKLKIDVQIEVSFSEDYMVAVDFTDFGEPIFEKRTNIKMSSYPIKLGDWIFVATVDHTPNGNIFSGVPGIEIPKKYRIADANCEHCGFVRDRKNTYIVFNTITKQFKQVGKTCLKDYTGHELPRKFYNDWHSAMDDDDWFSGGGAPRIEHYNLSSYIAVSLALLKLINSVGEFNKQTPLKFKDFFFDKDYRIVLQKQYGRLELTDKERKTAEDAISYVANEMKDTNEFLISLKILAKNGTFQSKHAILAAYIIKVYYQHLSYLKEKKSDTSSFVGEIGSVIEFDGKVTRVLEMQSSNINDYITIRTFLNQFLGTDGNTYVWFTSKAMKEGADVHVKAKIKAHKEYNGKKQNIITRAKTTLATTK
jgi:hypothetical protein